MWEGEGVVPTMALEMVSHKPGGEYDRKMEIYSKLGVLYYVIYNPEFWQRDRHQPFEVYKLDATGNYQQQLGKPYWMPEVGLGIGRYPGKIGGLPQEMLTWYDEQGKRHLSAVEAEQSQVQQALGQAQQAQQEADQLANFLRSQGFDPNNLPCKSNNI